MWRSWPSCTSPTEPHILIVDDNATNRVVAQALCEMFGCTSECAEDGLEAVEAVKNRHFDLILMDIKMPRMDGVQATRAIRAHAGPGEGHADRGADRQRRSGRRQALPRRSAWPPWSRSRSSPSACARP